MGEDTIAKCGNCNVSGMVDSGAPDPQGYFISSTCPVCLGLGEINIGGKTPVGDCCDCDIYVHSYQYIDRGSDKEFSASYLYTFAVDMHGHIVAADHGIDDSKLCRRLMEEFCS